jgi:hypothetical protein
MRHRTRQIDGIALIYNHIMVEATALRHLPTRRDGAMRKTH